jgi:hypothetical protein
MAEAEIGSKPSSPSETAGSKRPLSAKSKDGEQLSEKKLRRLEKNRLSARECRRRKRETTEHIERQINILEGENLRLRLQLQVSFDFRFSSGILGGFNLHVSLSLL